MSESKADVWQELRKAFPKEVVGLLPKVNCYQCAQATKSARSALDKHCAKHQMGKCKDCGAFITEGHIHLDYVGHAAVTDRLNTVLGPGNWGWEPLSVDEYGMPRMDSQGNLWIKLLVREPGTSEWMYRIGYGDGSNSIKELIGDALRNAAMRFGVALDLWSKDELESTLSDPSVRNTRPTERGPYEKPSKPAAGSTAPKLASQTEKAAVAEALRSQGVSDEDMRRELTERYGVVQPERMTSAEAQNVLNIIEANLTKKED